MRLPVITSLEPPSHPISRNTTDVLAAVHSGSAFGGRTERQTCQRTQGITSHVLVITNTQNRSIVMLLGWGRPSTPARLRIGHPPDTTEFSIDQFYSFRLTPWSIAATSRSPVPWIFAGRADSTRALRSSITEVHQSIFSKQSRWRSWRGPDPGPEFRGVGDLHYKERVADQIPYPEWRDMGYGASGTIADAKIAEPKLAYKVLHLLEIMCRSDSGDILN
jgi:hypothetical protein